jgi:hypothetical protein
MNPHNFLQGHRCPYCAATQPWSNNEKEILDFIKQILPNEIVEENNRTILNGKEIDIYIPSKKVGFEFDGLYYHSDMFINDDYHKKKTELANQKGVRLVHIFEDEWLYKQDIVKDKIKNILNVSSDNKIYARKCIVKEINSRIRNEFLEKNHIQGGDKANVSLGLFFKEQLVGVFSLCKPRLNLGKKSSNDNEYELSRYATLLGYNIVGGFSKVLKYTLDNYNIKQLYTYADLRWTAFDNNVYSNNNFDLVGISSPNYYYTNNNQKRENRFKYRKSELKKLFPNIYSDKKTEAEIMTEAGYFRIYDCGCLKYKYKIEK